MDSDRIEREIVIAAPPDVVWGIVTEPKQMSQWLCDAADFEARAGTYGSMSWNEYGSFRVHVVRVERPRTFSFRWVFPEDSEPNETNSLLVEFTLTDENGATRVRLVESGFRAIAGRHAGGNAAYIASREHGWDQYMMQLLDYVAQKANSATR